LRADGGRGRTQKPPQIKAGPLPTEHEKTQDETSATAMVAKLREEFVERTWFALLALTVVAAILLPLRALIYLGWTWTTNVALALVAIAATAFCLRRRMPPRARAVFPIVLLLLSAVGAILRNGLQDNGITYLVLVNVLVAMLFGRRVVLAIFGASTLVVLIAALGFTSGLFKLRFGVDYAMSPLGWAYAGFTVLSLSFVVLRGISAYRRSLQHLIERVTAQREEISKLANHDALTGLPSSRLGRDRLQVLCNLAARNRAHVGLLFIDLDGFKAVNDTYGHDAGDQVLKAVATRLTDSVRNVDTVARQGGDEFIVILNGVNTADDASQVAGKILATLAQPVSYGDIRLHIGASIGIALFPDQAATPEELLRGADAAMYTVKKAGKGGYALLSAACPQAPTTA
jgi:diguanylate cyclase (GGDEF)-like protein